MKKFYNGKIYTKETLHTWMIVKDGKIHEVGSEEREFRGETINLEGKLVLPGIHDSHIHAYSYGRSHSRIKLHKTTSIQELQDKVREFAKDNSHEWVLGHGWDQDRMDDGRYPNRQDIDVVISDRPVLLYRACNHIGLVNSLALEIMGIDKDTPDPEGGQIDRDGDGKPTGILREEGLSLVAPYIQPLEEKYRTQYYREGIQACLEKGITAIHTNDGQAWRYYHDLAERDELPLRVYLTLKYSDLDKDAPVPEPNTRIGFLTSRRIKLFADGSLGGETAALRENYTGLDHSGILIDSPEIMKEKIAKIHSLGYQLEVHAIGDYAAEVVMDGFEAAGITRKDRAIITHCQILADDLIERMATNGYIANIQPPFVPTDSRWAEKRLGTGERLRYSYAWKTLLDRGVQVAGGSDAPIEDPDPFYGMYCAIHRPDPSGRTWRSNECLSFEEALSIYTEAGAYAVGEEQRLGRLEPGKQADFVIVNAEIMDDTKKLLDDPLHQVWVAGELRHQSSR